MIKTIFEAYTFMLFEKLPTSDEATKRYRELAKKWHPDMKGNHDKFCDLHESYSIIKNYYLAERNRHILLSESISSVIASFELIEELLTKRYMDINGEIINIGDVNSGKVHLIIDDNILAEVRYINHDFAFTTNLKCVTRYVPYEVNKLSAVLYDRFIGDEISIKLKIYDTDRVIVSDASIINFVVNIGNIRFLVQLKREMLVVE